ncbi:thiol-disulfide oxidoreductase ResA [Salinibacillus xinjiangensis]|uniref:Thiol-disulfide oxidoreductase ResA n=1 Tax=Salinibacillus xinjiangensis TaxID=1229268 RepID=A0A6G1X6L1_9BACI|nr:thiol-disulfide oxidoreductase ResA [Salinibacillus xinjiangensis]MRG86448.1 thiol-disulfide oxidoreductase ResA [Salinibacillus xinjiangensis]
MAKNKKQKRLIFRSVILLILIGAVVFALVTNLKKEEEVVAVGEQAPPFELKQVNVDGEQTLNLHEDFEGKGVMLNFWATYCDPCKEEMPYMQSLYPKYKEKGVEILAVSVDATELVINNWISKNELTFPIVHDQKGAVMDAYDVFNLPSTFFINPDGTVERKVDGALTLDKLDGYLEEIVPESEK